MKFIIANWKMNNGFDDADKWLDEFLSLQNQHYKDLEDKKIVVCPPNILLDYIDSELMEGSLYNLEKNMEDQGRSVGDFGEEELNKIILESRPFSLGGQDCHFELSGSYTGDVSAKSLREVGCEYVILGHSERRQYYRETNEIVAKKIATALSQKLTPIICVGESLQIRQDGLHLQFIEQQILSTIADNESFEDLIIAYEPIWSIGTGIVPDKLQILEVANLVHKIFTTHLNKKAKKHFLLYGGSVSSKNSSEIMQIQGISGLLVGKSSLDGKEFIQICCS